MRTFGPRLTKILGSRRFYWILLGFLVFEAVWVALSAQYPMAFDEDFHFGIIQLYAQQWSPVLPADAGSSGVFGPVIADPSYLYHYLMSFPYRLITVFTDSQAAAVIFLRLINVALFALAVVLFARLLVRVGVSRALANTALALFILIPVVPLLAGQINYDNLLMVVVAGTCLLVVRLYEGFQKHGIDLPAVVLLVALCAFGAAVKYAFIPLAIVAVMYCLVMGWRAFGGKQVKKLAPAIRKSYAALTPPMRVGLVLVFVTAFGFAATRYGSNMITYGSPIPDCAKVMSVKQCLNYGPWGRNYNMSLKKTHVDANPVGYTTDEWLKGLHKRLFFMINGAHHHFYHNYPPPPLPANTATMLALVGFLTAVVFARHVFTKNPLLVFLFIMSFVYIAALWANNYSQYLQTGGAVAVNGRYLIPILLPLAAILGAGLHAALRRLPALKPYLAALVILLFLQGGGLTSFILRSDPTWHWPNKAVVEVNKTAKKLLSHVVYMGRV